MSGIALRGDRKLRELHIIPSTDTGPRLKNPEWTWCSQEYQRVVAVWLSQATSTAHRALCPGTDTAGWLPQSRLSSYRLWWAYSTTFPIPIRGPRPLPAIHVQALHYLAHQDHERLPTDTAENDLGVDHLQADGLRGKTGPERESRHRSDCLVQKPPLVGIL